MARAYGKTIDIMAAEELVSRVGENSRMLDNELKRLSAMLEGESISRSDIEALVARTAKVKPWDLLNAVSARDMKRALELYQLQPPRSEVRLFSLLVTRLRELICAKALDARGEGRNLAQVLGLQGWQVRNHVGWARKYSMEELVCALRTAVDIEAALKGSADSELALPFGSYRSSDKLEKPAKRERHVSRFIKNRPTLLWTRIAHLNMCNL